MATQRQLIVLGGGGFSMGDSPMLDRYCLQASGKAKPRICFLGTASGDTTDYLLKFYRAHAGYDCQPSHLSLFRPHTTDIAGFLAEQDVIFVGGGNTRSMLALWREWGVDVALRRAYDAGVVIGGISAGMICWFDMGLTDSNGGTLQPINGLGWLPGGACPHFDGEPLRRPALEAAVANGAMPSSWAAEDGVALHFIDEALAYMVSSRPHASAWRVEITAQGRLTSQRHAARYLGEAENTQ
jgi:peptidase E